MQTVDKGTRVAIVRGRKGNGVNGTVFWIGDDKYNEGKKRFGVRGDDGETYWVSADNVEPTDAPEAEPEAPEFEKGDRVEFEHRGQAGIGEVFWVGPSKHSPGYRVGIKLEDGDFDGEEDLWLDSRQVRQVLDGAAPAAPRGSAGAEDADAEAPPPELTAPALAEAPPLEDGDPGYTEVPPMPEDWNEEDPPF